MLCPSILTDPPTSPATSASAATACTTAGRGIGSSRGKELLGRVCLVTVLTPSRVGSRTVPGGRFPGVLSRKHGNALDGS
eukprot:2989022-Prymnesium_polylepis.1